jgi:hypothetical protein
LLELPSQLPSYSIHIFFESTIEFVKPTYEFYIYNDDFEKELEQKLNKT